MERTVCGGPAGSARSGLESAQLVFSPHSGRLSGIVSVLHVRKPSVSLGTLLAACHAKLTQSGLHLKAVCHLIITCFGGKVGFRNGMIKALAPLRCLSLGLRLSFFMVARGLLSAAGTALPDLESQRVGQEMLQVAEIPPAPVPWGRVPLRAIFLFTSSGFRTLKGGLQEAVQRNANGSQVGQSEEPPRGLGSSRLGLMLGDTAMRTRDWGLQQFWGKK